VKEFSLTNHEGVAVAYPYQIDQEMRVNQGILVGREPDVPQKAIRD
jgi:hypothetical protein